MRTAPKFSRLDPGKRRERILDAGNGLFAARGYDEVSVEDIASSAGVTRGLVHHYFGGRKEVYIALLETARRSARATTTSARGPQRPGAPDRQRVALACLDRAAPPRSGLPRSAAARTSPTPRSGTSSPTLWPAPSRSSPPSTPTSPTTHLTTAALRARVLAGLNRSATRHWLQDEATREQTHELIATTLEHVLRTSCTPPKPNQRTRLH